MARCTLRSAFLLIAALALLSSVVPQRVMAAGRREAERDPGLVPLYTVYDPLRIGVAVTRPYLQPTNIHHDLLDNFNSFVLGNEMKMDAIQPTEGQFNFTAGDELIRFAAERGATVRGHTLLWHSQYPRWFFVDQVDGDDTGDAAGNGTNVAAQQVSREVLLQRIEDHVTTVVSHFRGQVDYWDVVNEVVGDDGGLRDSPYFQIVGSDEFIRVAFQAAHRADPDAQLFINDYNVSQAGPKQDALYNLVRDLRADGVPIDGVGLQCHINLQSPPLLEILEAIDRFASLGVDVHVTELDVSVYSSNNESQREPDAELLEQQAARYRGLFQVFRREADRGNLQLVTLWGVADDDTWLNGRFAPGRIDYPLLFDQDLNPKPAYRAIVEP